MSLTTFAPIETTLHTTDLWLRDLMDDLGWQDCGRAYRALQVVLHALRDRLPVEAVAALGAQLPLLVRGIYYEDWRPGGKPLGEIEKEDFFAHIAAALQNNSEVDAERVARAVFNLLKRYAPSGEIRDERLVLPPEIFAP
jgi:uncharacterized protein (DUF2267 family)